MKSNRVVVLCNAMDDELRNERRITSDSPAASKKVFDTCESLSLAGIEASVLSLGRGGGASGRRSFAPKSISAKGFVVRYARFSQSRLFSKVVSLFSLAAQFHVMGFTRNRDCRTVVVAYNRLTAYIPAVLLARLTGAEVVVDIEDGELADSGSRFASLAARFTSLFYEWFAGRKVLLACTALAGSTRVRPYLCHYGNYSPVNPGIRWCGPAVNILASGTLSESTGLDMLIGAIREMRRERKGAGGRPVCFHVSGQGPLASSIAEIAGIESGVEVVFHGRLSFDEYRELLLGCEVGLALKPNSGPLAHTTFPSKTIEMAGAGLLLVTTDISDVRKIFGESALYLVSDSPGELHERIEWLLHHKEQAALMAQTGESIVSRDFSQGAVGQRLAAFLFPAEQEND